jgi:DNA-binding HxlR family transcriptional regulator
MRPTLAADNCPAARALDVIGERWSLLIVREALDGPRRFDDFRDRLTISDHTLARRLSELVDRQILQRRPYRTRPIRYEYLLTERGRGLATILAALAAWGEQWTDPDPDAPAPRPRPAWLSSAAHP